MNLWVILRGNVNKTLKSRLRLRRNQESGELMVETTEKSEENGETTERCEKNVELMRQRRNQEYAELMVGITERNQEHVDLLGETAERFKKTLTSRLRLRRKQANGELMVGIKNTLISWVKPRRD